uniref:AsmA-like C-terminal region-containing protein n=2 Tax=Limimaricola TaxID=2211638 RepID=UPI0035121494
PDAGAVLRSAGLYGTATGGALDLTLLPDGRPGHYTGDLDVAGLRVRDAPAMAQLLDAISVVGLLQQLDGKGLAFDRILADFRLSPDMLEITQSSATGPGLGISLDGRYSLASRRMAFQGVVSPFYLVNSLGSFLTRPGEGLIGFNYTLGGTPEDPQVSVNPLSALTPGLFRELFRRPPPT